MAYQAHGIRATKKKAKHAGFRSRLKSNKSAKLSKILKRRMLKGRYKLAKTLKKWV
jgi:ribosomal protein L34